MPNQEHKRERERDQTHSYWYIPSAPRENYSLLVMKSVGMMKMATGEGFPPPEGCQNGSRFVFGGYGGFWRWNSRSMFLCGIFGLHKRCWSREQGRGVSGLSTRQGGGPKGVGTLPTLMGSPRLFWPSSFTSWPSFGPKISSVKFQVNWTPFGFPFSAILKNIEKTETGTGL